MQIGFAKLVYQHDIPPILAVRVLPSSRAWATAGHGQVWRRDIGSRQHGDVNCVIVALGECNNTAYASATRCSLARGSMALILFRRCIFIWMREFITYELSSTLKARSGRSVAK